MISAFLHATTGSHPIAVLVASTGEVPDVVPPGLRAEVPLAFASSDPADGAPMINLKHTDGETEGVYRCLEVLYMYIYNIYIFIYILYIYIINIHIYI
jgi:hypothetical protein